MLEEKLQTKLMEAVRNLSKSYFEYWRSRTRKTQKTDFNKSVKDLINALFDFNSAMGSLFPTQYEEAEKMFSIMLKVEDFVEPKYVLPMIENKERVLKQVNKYTKYYRDKEKLNG